MFFITINLIFFFNNNFFKLLVHFEKKKQTHICSTFIYSERCHLSRNVKVGRVRVWVCVYVCVFVGIDRERSLIDLLLPPPPPPPQLMMMMLQFLTLQPSAMTWFVDCYCKSFSSFGRERKDAASHVTYDTRNQGNELPRKWHGFLLTICMCVCVFEFLSCFDFCTVYTGHLSRRRRRQVTSPLPLSHTPQPSR